LVLPTRQHGLRGIIESFGEAENVDLAPTVEIDSINAILNLVVESDFATVLPCISIRQKRDDVQLRGRRIVSPTPARQVVCVTHPRRPLSPATAAFIAVLVRHIRGPDGGASKDKVRVPSASRKGTLENASFK
jgi:DNA-binding transcriptional LysR family regulator